MPQGLSFGDRAAGRDNKFNLIRMIAASGVLVSHAWPATYGGGVVEPLESELHGITLGTVCVYIFFAISGFFITKSFDRSDGIGRFLLARALRLFPALIVVLCLTVLAGLWLTTAPIDVYLAAVPDYLLRNLTLFRLQYALPGVFEDNPFGPGINGSLWTLNYEVLCYLGVFLAGVAGLLRAPRGFVLAFMVVIGLCLLAPLLPYHPRLVKLFELGLPFALGAGAYVWRDRIPLGLAPGAALAALAVAAWWGPADLFRPAFVLALSYWVFLLGFARVPALLGYNRLGDYSYGMYIYAFPLQQLAAHWGTLWPSHNMAVALVMVLPCAVLSWHLVERPALAWVPRNGRPAVREAAP